MELSHNARKRHTSPGEIEALIPTFDELQRPAHHGQFYPERPMSVRATSARAVPDPGTCCNPASLHVKGWDHPDAKRRSTPSAGARRRPMPRLRSSSNQWPTGKLGSCPRPRMAPMPTSHARSGACLPVVLRRPSRRDRGRGSGKRTLGVRVRAGATSVPDSPADIVVDRIQAHKFIQALTEHVEPCRRLEMLPRGSPASRLLAFARPATRLPVLTPAPCRNELAIIAGKGN